MTLASTFIPELGTPYQGSVRDIYDLKDRLLMITSDRISCFDVPLKETIPYKGQVLTSISHFWFEETQDIISNHIISRPDPVVLLTKKCKPIPIEVIVRGFLAGSLQRMYKAGGRTKCGVTLPDALSENAELPSPIITPTTKAHEGHDEDTSREEILSSGIVAPSVWQEIEATALLLYERGRQKAKEQGLILVDTKYEFGLDEKGELVLIDEIHTPDSSRYCFTEDRENAQVKYPDKEFVREWLRQNDFTGTGAPPPLPSEVIAEASRGYVSIYEALVGKPFQPSPEPAKERVLNALVEKGIITGAFTLLLSEGPGDSAAVSEITQSLSEKGMPYSVIGDCIHKQPEALLQILTSYRHSIEPVTVMTVEEEPGFLNGLAAKNLEWPVIASPPQNPQNLSQEAGQI